MTVDLPDGTSDTVVGVTDDGMILTAGGWQSVPMPDGSERWINVRTAQVMEADGRIVETRSTGAWWIVAAGAIGALAILSAGR